MSLKDRRLRGEFIQASYRSSAALLGIAFIKNIYGDVGMAPLMIIGSVPLYNVMAVVILSFTNPEGAVLDRRMLGKTAAGILKNPIILGILSGRSVPGVPGAAAGGDSCDAGVCRNRQLLCDGAEHGT